MANRYSVEVRARAVRMVFEHQGSYETQAGAITVIPQTLREWVKQAEKESGMRDGLAPAEARRLTLARCTVARLMKQIALVGSCTIGDLRRRADWCTPRIAAGNICPFAATVNGLYKTKLAHRQGPWRSMQDLEMATPGWVDCFNHTRLLGPIGGIPPAEAEDTYHAQRDVPDIAA